MQPWDFHTAHEESRAAEQEQRRVESEVTQAYRAFAKAQRLYDVALARRMYELKAQGVAVTACKTLAQGEPAIAQLRAEKYEAEGLKETAKVAAWRVNADRRDVESFVDWSKRRDLAEAYGQAPRPEFSAPIGGSAVSAPVNDHAYDEACDELATGNPYDTEYLPPPRGVSRRVLREYTNEERVKLWPQVPGTCMTCGFVGLVTWLISAWLLCDECKFAKEAFS